MPDHEKTRDELARELSRLRRRVGELEASDCEAGRAEESLQWLSETALEFVGFSPERDIYEFIGSKVKELLGKAIVGVNQIDEKRNVLRIRSLTGVSRNMLARAEKLAGRNALGADFEGVDEEAKEALAAGTLTEIQGGLYRVFFHRVPRPACLAIEKLLGIEGIYSIGLRRKGRLFGNVTVVTLKGARVDKSAMEAFVNQASAALERRQAEEERRLSDQRFRTLAENVTDLIWTMRFEGLEELSRESLATAGAPSADALLERCRFTFVSPSSERILGYPPEEVMQRSVKDLLTEESYARCREFLAKQVAAGLEDPGYTHMRESLELEHVTRGGRLISCELTARFLRDEEGPIVGLMGVTRDISERKRSQEVLREERNRLRRLLEMHEQERRLVAYEIHDGVVQPLTGALMQLEGHQWVLKKERPSLSTDSCQKAVELLRHGIGDARRLISGLRPPVLDEFGVLSAIGNLIEDSRGEHDTKIEFVHHTAIERLAPPLETAVFRIIQESLINALRHSRSEKVKIRLDQDEAEIRIEVADWGVGFDPTTIEKSRFGLEAIRQRAQLFGGHAAIESVLGEGTRVRVRLPLGASEKDRGHGQDDHHRSDQGFGQGAE